MRTGNGLWRSALLREKCAPVDDVFGARTVFCHTRRSLTCSRLRPFLSAAPRAEAEPAAPSVHGPPSRCHFHGKTDARLAL